MKEIFDLSMSRGKFARQDGDPTSDIIRISLAVGPILRDINSNKDALAVLDSFGLGEIAFDTFWVSVFDKES